MTPAIPATASVDPVLLCRRIEAMFARNPFVRYFDLVLVEAEVGRAVVAMTVSDALMNAHGGAHGGAVWTLADMVFGAAGFYDGPMLTVGSDLTFIRPARHGATLWATGRELTRKGRTGMFEIIVASARDDPHAVVAAGTFTGRWYATAEQFEASA